MAGAGAHRLPHALLDRRGAAAVVEEGDVLLPGQPDHHPQAVLVRRGRAASAAGTVYVRTALTPLRGHPGEVLGDRLAGREVARPRRRAGRCRRSRRARRASRRRERSTCPVPWAGQPRSSLPRRVRHPARWLPLEVENPRLLPLSPSIPGFGAWISPGIARVPSALFDAALFRPDPRPLLDPPLPAPCRSETVHCCRATVHRNAGRPLGATGAGAGPALQFPVSSGVIVASTRACGRRSAPPRPLGGHVPAILGAAMPEENVEDLGAAGARGLQPARPDGAMATADPDVELVPLRAVLEGGAYHGHDGACGASWRTWTKTGRASSLAADEFRADRRRTACWCMGRVRGAGPRQRRGRRLPRRVALLRCAPAR